MLSNEIVCPSIEPVHLLPLLTFNRYEVGNVKFDKFVFWVGTKGIPSTEPIWVTDGGLPLKIGFTTSSIVTLGLR